jgi:hypothetical protein
MKITATWLKKWSACSEGTEWLLAQKERDGAKVCRKLVVESRIDWANWTIARLLNRKQRIQYAIFAAEQVIEIFEKLYPNDKRPREAIEAAKAVLKNGTKKNKDAAAYAAYAADAADAAYAADAADTAARAARAARAADAAYAMKIKIFEYGIGLIK